MKVLKIGDFSPSHTDVVFENKEAALQRNMLKTIGRFDEDSGSIAFIDDKQIGSKYASLYRSGFGLHIEKINNALYVASVDDVLAMNEHKLDFESMSALNEGVESVEYLNESGFTAHIEESETDSFTGLWFGHKSLVDNDGDETAFSVGQVTADGKFTLRPDIANLISSDFEIKVDGDGEWEIVNKTLTAREVVNIIKFLRQSDINESVQVDALAEVQGLLSKLGLELRHGNLDEVEAVKVELNDILDSYEQAQPPAKGVDAVRKEIKSMLKPKDIVAESLSWLNKNGL
ncbi:hypothetical protein [Psychromonas ossibalaenae]|uniref:hypothetical protein n=1 Tax=Psychromonas ossibalaenae TaxID=444922 RepID=UPI0003605E72|nr:hypothetical protein [Psychromonas ossibalaenae]